MVGLGFVAQKLIPKYSASIRTVAPLGSAIGLKPLSPSSSFVNELTLRESFFLRYV